MLPTRDGAGDGLQQGFRIWMEGGAVEFDRRSDFNDPPEVHDGHALAQVFDHGKIVGDKEVGQTELLLDIIEEVDDLGLNREIEGGDGFIGDDQFGFHCQGAGDADALPLPAREFVGIAIKDITAKADGRQQFNDEALDRGRGRQTMDE